MSPAILALKKQVIDAIIVREGGYANNPADSGGETMYGITVAVARRYGYKGPMRALPRELAFEIYEDRYWNFLRLDTVAGHSLKVAEELADTGVNMGVERAAEFLQRALNALNNRGTYYPDLPVDRAVGTKTLGALGSYFSRRGQAGETVLLRMLNALQGAFYIELAERRQKDEQFIFGWFQNRVA